MTSGEELVLEVEGLTADERAALLAELEQIEGVTVSTAPPSLAEPMTIAVISLIISGISAVPVVIDLVDRALKAIRARRKQPVVGKIYLPNGDAIELDKIDRIVKP